MGIAVEDPDETRAAFEALGFELQWTESLEDQGICSQVLSASGLMIEILEAVDEESSLSSFLDGRGPGLHHLCLRVDSLEGSLRSQELEDFTFVDREPVADLRGRRIFIHPRSTGGVLIGLVELHDSAHG